ARGRLAHGPLRARRPGGDRRARARERSAVGEAAGAEDGAAAAPRRDGERGAARPQEWPRLLHVLAPRVGGDQLEPERLKDGRRGLRKELGGGFFRDALGAQRL